MKLVGAADTYSQRGYIPGYLDISSHRYVGFLWVVGSDTSLLKKKQTPAGRAHVGQPSRVRLQVGKHDNPTTGWSHDDLLGLFIRSG